MGNYEWQPPPKWEEIFAHNLKYFRLVRNLKQSDVAAQFSLSTSTVNQWENCSSTPNLKLLVKVCMYFGKSLDEMLFERAGETGDRASPSAAESPPGAEEKKEEKEGMEERIRRLESMMFQQQNAV